MTNARPPITGRDVAGAGALLLSVNLVCAGIGAGIGALVGATVPLFLLGFFIGFFLGIFVVARRFHEL
jgi:F0F1-type ATP synthase assembly protein I